MNDNEKKDVESTPVDNNKPQVVNPNNNEEVKEVKVDNDTTTTNTNNSNVNKEEVPTSVELEKNTTGEKKKGHPVFLVLLLLFLFAFVFFLPEISQFITDYKNEKTGANHLKSGKMTCTMSNETNNIDYSYEIEFDYEKNKLKKSTMTTTARLSDNATDSSTLTERQDSCLALQTVLEDNDIGMSADCSLSAALQRTEQVIDYKKLDLDFISTNIGEFEGFYPEYELDESVTSIENDLENSGYTCERNEY